MRLNHYYENHVCEYMKQINMEFLNGKTVLITGVTGMIGSAIADALCMAGKNIRVLGMGRAKERAARLMEIFSGSSFFCASAGSSPAGLTGSAAAGAAGESFCCAGCVCSAGALAVTAAGCSACTLFTSAAEAPAAVPVIIIAPSIPAQTFSHIIHYLFSLFFSAVIAVTTLLA